VLLHPFSREPQRSPGQIAGDDLAVSDRDLCSFPSVAGVKVGRREIAVYISITMRRTS
jgi:hypothetical protein